MRVVGPGSKQPLTAQEIDARVESELLFLERLEARGELSDEEKRKRLTDLAKWSTREYSKLPTVQAVEKIMNLLLNPKTGGKP
jgi:hypothetical protein